MRGGWLMLAAAAALLPAAPLLAQPATMADRAGIRLPPALCTLTQERVDSAPDGIYAIYRLPGDGSLRIYVARATQSASAEFIDNQRAISGYFGDIVLVRELAPPPGAPEGRARLWRGILDGSRVLTGMWLWHRDGLSIKLRGTVPIGEGERLWPEIECAVRALATPAAG